jgi:hypothetical protein
MIDQPTDKVAASPMGDWIPAPETAVDLDDLDLFSIDEGLKAKRPVRIR